MLQLQHILEAIEKSEPEALQKDGYPAAVGKEVLFAFAIDGKEGGGFTL